MRVNQPNLFLLGAPKCGTTAIYTYLGTHPHVFFPRDKEPHFYAEEFPSHRTCTTTSHYRRLYATVQPEHRVIGDASVLMLYSQSALGRILTDCPSARFVVAVRNPAELVVSLHRQFVLSGRERDVEFTTAWQREVELARRSGEDSAPAQAQVEWPILHYPQYGKLGTRLAQLLAQVEAQRVHVVFLDDIRNKPREVYLRLLDFLDLPDDGREDFRRINEGREHRWPWMSHVIQSRPRLMYLLKQTGIAGPLRTWGTRRSAGTSLSVETQRELGKFFKAEVESLAQLTERDLADWL